MRLTDFLTADYPRDLGDDMGYHYDEEHNDIRGLFIVGFYHIDGKKYVKFLRVSPYIIIHESQEWIDKHIKAIIQSDKEKRTAYPKDN